MTWKNIYPSGYFITEAKKKDLSNILPFVP